MHLDQRLYSIQFVLHLIRVFLQMLEVVVKEVKFALLILCPSRESLLLGKLSELVLEPLGHAMLGVTSLNACLV